MQIKNFPTTVLVILLIVASFFIGTLWMRVQQLEENQTNPTAANNNLAAGNQPTPVPGDVPDITDEDWITGNPDATIALIEYSDLECPYCQQFHTTAQQLIEGNDDVKWVYRHFPLDAIHPSARPRAIASECVGELAGNEAFWEFVDAIFASETAVTDSELSGLAAQVGVNANEFDSCVSEGSVEEKVNSDMAGGQSAGVSGTPGNFLLNTETGEVSYIPGAVPLVQLEQAISELR